jgi:hypothetical protein
LKKKLFAVVIMLVVALAGLSFAGCSADAADSQSSASASSAAASDAGSGEITVNVLVECYDLAEQGSELAKDYPEDGEIYPEAEVTLPAGSTALDALEATGVEYEGTEYVSAIGGLAEGDAGPSSGWLYQINGGMESVGVSEYVLKDTDYRVSFTYIVDFNEYFE